MSKTKKRDPSGRRSLLPEILSTALLFLGLLCYFASRWYLFSFSGQSFNALLFTLFSGLAGTDSDLLVSFLRGPLLLSLCCAAFFAFLLCQRSPFRLVVRLFRRRVTVSPVPPPGVLLAVRPHLPGAADPSRGGRGDAGVVSGRPEPFRSA